MREIKIVDSGSGIEYNSANYELLSLEEVKNYFNKDIVVVVGKENLIGLYELYRDIGNLYKKNNRVILIVQKENTEMCNKLIPLVIGIGIYNIYVYEEDSDVDNEYIENAIDTEMSLDDCSNFIKCSVVYYPEVSDVLLKIINMCYSDDDTGLLMNVIKENKEILENSAVYNELINSMNFKLLGDLGRVDDYKKEISDKDKEIVELKDNISMLEGSIDNLRLNVEDLERDKESLMKNANKSNGFSNVYSTIKMNLLSKADWINTKNILYFKEITYIRRMNTLITQLFKVLGEVKKLKVKLLIYDTDKSYVGRYNGLNIVDYSGYMNNKDVLTNSKIAVIAEPNQNIITDVIKEDLDVLIVYDRMRYVKDVIEGSVVYKYWVLNSLSEFESLKDKDNIDEENVISGTVRLKKAMKIPLIKEYDSKDTTDATRITKYLKMRCSGEEGAENLIQRILKPTGIVISSR